VGKTMNVVFDDSVGAQARQWFKDVLASSKIDFNKAIASTVTVRVVAEPSVPGHNDYACTSAISGGWLIEIRRGLDDPASPLVANIPGPARLFFMETVAHELAHVLIGQSTATPAVLCPLFARAVGGIVVIGKAEDWNPTTKPSVIAMKWEDRIEEAVAETVKDAALPDRRVYDNRTNWRITEASFKALMMTLLGAGSSFVDEFQTDSSSRYTIYGDVIYSNGRARGGAGSPTLLMATGAYFGDDLHVQIEVFISDPATAVVGVGLSDPAVGGSVFSGEGNTILFALVNGNVGVAPDLQPASFSSGRTFLDLQLNGSTATAIVKDAAQAVLYSQTFATPEMAAFQPALLLYDDSTEVERWSAAGAAVTITATPDRVVPEQRTTLVPSPAVSPGYYWGAFIPYPHMPPLNDPFLVGDWIYPPGGYIPPLPWPFQQYYDRMRQLRLWVYDISAISDLWQNDEYLECWGMPFQPPLEGPVNYDNQREGNDLHNWSESWRAPDFTWWPGGMVGPGLAAMSIYIGGWVVAYTDGTVPIRDTPFTSGNAFFGGTLGGAVVMPYDWDPYMLSAGASSLGPERYAIQRLAYLNGFGNPDFWWAPDIDWYSRPVGYVGRYDLIGDGSWSVPMSEPPPDVPVYLVLEANLTVWGLLEADARAPYSELSYAWGKSQQEAARSLWPKVVHVVPERTIPGTVEVQSAQAEVPDWPYVSPFVAASAGAPAALRLR
jgi:hypothetical protein